jgi:phosphoserine phosphatase RsbU/P
MWDRLPEFHTAPDPSEVVDDLVTRVRDVLHVDTVAILLLDGAGTHLIASVARGLEEEVRQGVRLPVGHGFAGRIAATRAPVYLEHVGPETVVNPILWRKGIQSMLGVPLIHNGRLLGVLHVGSMARRRFGDDERAQLQQVGAHIAAALNAQQSVTERASARMVQESLLPTDLPDVDGLEFASRFVAAEDFGVGGDWYDAFRLPNGRIGVVIGDVAGSGLQAAVVMGRLRSALRAYALESESPSDVLFRLERKFAHFEPTAMATVLYLIIEPDLESFTSSSTAHPPPIVARPGAEATVLDCSPSPPIGAHIDTQRVDVVSELVPGMAVAVYTDGLIERRGESIDLGLERLRAAFYAGPPEEVCAAVMSALIGSSPVADDTALLVFRRRP